MKQTLIVAFALWSAVVSAQTDLGSLNMKWERFRLDNGMQVVLQPDTSQKEASVEFWIKAGARDEAPGMFGFAHFFEHATPYGFRKDTSAMKLLSSYSTNSNAQTKEDYTRYYVQVKPGGMEVALRYAADRLKADTATISNAAIEYHRKNVLNEMNRQELKPLYSPTAAQARAIATFGIDHPYGHGTYGTFEENKTFGAAQVKQWYADNFFPANTMLFVVGNFDPLLASQVIHKEFSSLPANKIEVAVPKTSITKVAGNFTLPTSALQHFLTLTWAIPGFASKYDPALYLLAYVVESRLAKDHPNLVSKAGALELFNLYQLGGQFGVYASFAQIGDSSKVEQYLYGVINNIADNGVPRSELDARRKRVLEDMASYMNALGFEGSRTDLLGEGLLFANDPDYYIKRLEKQAKLKSSDIRKAASEWLKVRAGRVFLVSSKK